MDSHTSWKTIKTLITQTPLIINPDRDAKTFQAALASIPTEKLQSYYRHLSGEDRRRFHYVANVCLGYESWSRLYQELVVQETQARLSDRLAEAYSHREEELHRREEELLAEVAALERENHDLRRENLQLKKEVTDLEKLCRNLERRQQQLLELVDRYKHLLQELKRFMAAEKTAQVAKK